MLLSMLGEYISTSWNSEFSGRWWCTSSTCCVISSAKRFHAWREKKRNHFLSGSGSRKTPKRKCNWNVGFCQTEGNLSYGPTWKNAIFMGEATQQFLLSIEYLLQGIGWWRLKGRLELNSLDIRQWGTIKKERFFFLSQISVSSKIK